jgi:hypothetical protein
MGEATVPWPYEPHSFLGEYFPPQMIGRMKALFGG